MHPTGVLIDYQTPRLLPAR